MDSTEAQEFSNGDIEDEDANVQQDQQSDDDDAGGLFGSGSEDEGDAASTNGRKRGLDDRDLDSGDDEGRNDRMDDDMDGYGVDEIETQQLVSMADVDIGRHACPKGSDNETYLLKFPSFMGIDHKKFSLHGFQPPSTDHHSAGPPSTTFSPAQTSKTTIRWRRSPKKRQKLQSNARIIRWSDGSLTLQLGSNVMEQYELSAKSLAPSKRSAYDARMDAHTYDARMDAHTYVAIVNEQTSFAQVTNHATTSLTVQTTTEQNDDALIRLQESMAAAVKGNKNAPDGGLAIISISEDPEQAKKRAELAEREKIRAQRRRQNQEERERDRANRVLGRSGLRTGGISGGLTVGGLEDEDGNPTSRPRAKPARKPRRRNSEYSDDESDFRNRGRTREDEYDEDDGFLVGSDEEPEVVPDDSEEEEEMEIDNREPTTKSTKKDSRPDEGDLAGGRIKRRRVVNEDDDEE